MTSQIRVYTIAEGRLDEFVEAWRTAVVPLRRQFGFAIDGAWLAREVNLFVWILRHEGPGTFDEADRAYYDSPERAALDPDPAALIESAEHHQAERVEP